MLLYDTIVWRHYVTSECDVIIMQLTCKSPSVGFQPNRPHDLAQLDAGDGAAAVAVEEGEDLAVLLDLVLRQEDVDILRLHVLFKIKTNICFTRDFLCFK